MTIREAIEKKIAELKHQLLEQESLNLFGASMYGSELCAGDMVGKETAITDKINHHLELLKMSEIDYTKDGFDAAIKDHTGKISDLEKQESELAKLKNEMNTKLDLLKELKGWRIGLDHNAWSASQKRNE